MFAETASHHYWGQNQSHSGLGMAASDNGEGSG